MRILHFSDISKKVPGTLFRFYAEFISSTIGTANVYRQLRGTDYFQPRTIVCFLKTSTDTLK
jgi:hypothetical protein